MASSLKKRNGTLELMRFVFCMTIFFFHVGKYLLGGFSLKNGVHIACFPHGAMGVEFFFLLSGIFLAQGVDKLVQRGEKRKNTVLDTGKFLWKKYGSTFPQHLVAFVVLFGVTVLVNHNVAGWSALHRLKQAIPSLFLVQMTGWRWSPLNHIEWYLSSMFIAFVIVYPLCRINFRVFTRYIAPIASAVLLLWMYRHSHALTGVTREMTIIGDFSIYKGNVRALAEIMLGTFVYSLGKYGLAPLKDRIGRNVRGALTAAEWVMYACALAVTLLTVRYRWEFATLAFIFAGVTLSFSGLTYSCRLLDNKVSYFLGKITLPIYLSQLAAFQLTEYLLAGQNAAVKIIVAIALTAVSSAITMLLGNFIGSIPDRISSRRQKAA